MRGILVLIAVMVLGGTAHAQSYVGDTACSGCHANAPTVGFFEGYRNSGHPWKLYHSAGSEPAADTWPHTPIPPLPTVDTTPLVWADVEYVIGNYYWKARFVRPDGYIYIGQADETTQWNIATQEWVPYHAGEPDKPYDCGRCHTTGYSADGNQDGLAGIVGTWTEEGIRCEACHGPASEHTGSGGTIPPPGGKECSECHYRDSEFRMPWKGGFTRHHQQSEDLAHSAHKNSLTCESCHNPHRSVVYEDGGTITHCSDPGCHPGEFANGYYAVASMQSLDCIDCHMPFMGKSAVAFNEHTGDIRGHLFRIMTEPVAAAANVYDVGGTLYWNQDGNGDSAATLDYSCLGCHLDLGAPITLPEAAAYAANIHTVNAAPAADITGDGVVGMADFDALLVDFGACPDPCPPRCASDINDDCVVDVRDFLLLLATWTE